MTCTARPSDSDVEGNDGREYNFSLGLVGCLGHSIRCDNVRVHSDEFMDKLISGIWQVIVRDLIQKS